MPLAIYAEVKCPAPLHFAGRLLVLKEASHKGGLDLMRCVTLLSDMFSFLSGGRGGVKG